MESKNWDYNYGPKTFLFLKLARDYQIPADPWFRGLFE